jgi:hypothetical protein
VQPLVSSQHFMEPEGSLPHSQELSTCTCHEPDQCSQKQPIISVQNQIISNFLRLGLPSGIFQPIISVKDPFYIYFLRLGLPSGHFQPIISVQDPFYIYLLRLGLPSGIFQLIICVQDPFYIFPPTSRFS